MKPTLKLNVNIGKYKVGELVAGQRGKIAFQYTDEWLAHGFSLSPIHLPFDNEVHIAQTTIFDGLYGCFGDSLPDSWGKLLMEKFFLRNNLSVSDIGPLDRLAYMGSRAMGALEYAPEIKPAPIGDVDLSLLAESAEKLISGSPDDILDSLLINGGSPGGARPKVVVAFSDDFTSCVSGANTVPDGYSHWIVKFFSNDENNEQALSAGMTEKLYSDMAMKAGLRVPETRLIDINGKVYFAIKRFDRAGNSKKHIVTLAGMIHADYSIPSIDYEILLGLTGRLTNDVREVEMAYRLAVFNVLSGNKDDHAKNFSFMMTEDRWSLTPAYDLTLSDKIFEHTTSMMGNGLPARKDMDKLADKFGIKNASLIQEEVRAAISNWKFLAKDRIPTPVINRYAKKLREIDARVY